MIVHNFSGNKEKYACRLKNIKGFALIYSWKGFIIKMYNCLDYAINYGLYI